MASPFNWNSYVLCQDKEATRLSSSIAKASPALTQGILALLFYWLWADWKIVNTTTTNISLNLYTYSSLCSALLYIHIWIQGETPPHPHGTPSLQVILTIIISYIVDTFVSQYRLSEKLREKLKKNQEEKEREEDLFAFCTKQAQSGLSVIAHLLHANGTLPDKSC